MPTIPKTFSKSRFDKNPNDFYETPYELTFNSLKWFRNNILEFKKDYDPNYYDILDVGYGTGMWSKAARTLFPKSYIAGIDVNVDFNDNAGFCDLIIENDYLKYEPIGYDLIMGNPPFSSKENKSLAKDIVLHSLKYLPTGGYLAMLFKTEFLACEERYIEIFRDKRPLFMLQCIQRVHWNNSKNSNTIEYAFFIWQKDYYPQYTSIEWLDWR